MNNRLLQPVFSATLFLSAFLIFTVQPMVSKMLLPILGGGPSVWNIAVVFFQAMLLAGYAYAHLIAKYASLRLQAFLHIGLLLVFTTFLPITLHQELSPPAESGQTLWQLGIMLACVGGPFFILAASAPLFQHWFSASTDKDAENPYFLYAVSNAGSMIALLGYPILIEPFLTLSQQSHAWFFGYGLLALLAAICAWVIRHEAKPRPSFVSGEDRKSITWLTRSVWVGLAFIPSSLMLGVTTFITTDLVSAPFLWVIPLALYLATFIIAFSRKPFLSVPVTRELCVYATCLVIVMFMIGEFISLRTPMLLIHLFTFFLCALLCHGELVRAKPSAFHLTEYFLWISVGGVLGGIFNALIAPKIFLLPLEYSLALCAVGFVIWIGTARVPVISAKFNAIDHKNKQTKLWLIDLLMIFAGIGMFLMVFFMENRTVQVVGTIGVFLYLVMVAQNRGTFAISALAALIIFQPMWGTGKKLLALDRNYFGVLKVYSEQNANFFYHGTTLHGAQSQEEKYKSVPVTYYDPKGPTGDIFNVLKNRGGKQTVAALGLGVGSVACYTAQDRTFDFYEINKSVVDIAKNPKIFSYLSGCDSPYSIILGDARLKIKQAADHSYDLIFIDTFSSDNIPVHIITKEAFIIYLQKLSKNGMIAINISNRYFDLRPTLTAIAKDLGLAIYFKYHKPDLSDGDISSLYTESLFAVMAEKPETIATFMEDRGWKPYTKPLKTPAWTDDYANILSSMYFFQ